MRICVATSNPGKLRDFAFAAEEASAWAGASGGSEEIDIQPLPSLAYIPAPPEDELTFEANACAKAIYYSMHAPELYVLADDSGLEVTCLDDAPGVRSARYADDQRFPSAPGSTLDERNNAALLRALDGIPQPCRQGRYRCVLALAFNGKIVAMADGSLEGRILTSPRGNSGFGYDPLFLVPEFDRTMSELDTNERLAVSHRGRALRSLLTRLRERKAVG